MKVEFNTSAQMVSAPKFMGATEDKVNKFRENLNNPNWEKKYYPQGDFIHMTQKGVTDGVEYELRSTGDVKEVGCWIMPTKILSKDKQVQALFKDKDKLAQGNVSFSGGSDDAFQKVSDTVKTAETGVAQNTPTQVATQAKKGSFKNGIANIWKFFSVTNQMVQATIKGAVYGAVAGVALLGGSWLFKSLPSALAKEGPGVWEIIHHPLKTMSKSGKVIAGVGSALVLGYNLVKGKLNANQNTAVIDHKLKTGHRDK